MEGREGTEWREGRGLNEGPVKKMANFWPCSRVWFIRSITACSDSTKWFQRFDIISHVLYSQFSIISMIMQKKTK